MPQSGLYDAARELLETAGAALEAAPAVAYVSVGGPAYDCDDQLTVHIDPLQTLGGDRSPSGFAASRQAPQGLEATLIITRILCAPALGPRGEIPAASDIDDAAQGAYGDVWRVWCRLTQILAQPDDEFLGGPCNLTRLVGIQPIEGQGQVWGWQLHLTTLVSTDGWAP